MLEIYADLRALTPEPPRWFDERGVPRWCDFQPGVCNDVYATEAVLIEIACQECGRRYRVAITWSVIACVEQGIHYVPDALARAIRAKTIHYGDPPCFECTAGATMNCIDLRVVEYWERQDALEGWRRRPELEIDLTVVSEGQRDEAPD